VATVLLTVLVAIGGRSAAAQRPTPIQLADLDQPPAAIGNLIVSGRVTLEAGPRPASDTPGSGPRINAETHYTITYGFQNHSQWRITPDHRQVVIRVRYDRIQWQPRHTIWFRDRPSAAGFWSDRLLLHELDHVRISTDPRLKKRFEELLRQRNPIKRTVASGDVVDRRYVDRIVQQHAAEVFAEINDLVAIRYKELDRLTSHGLLPVPSDSPVAEYLKSEFDPTEAAGTARRRRSE
jgi:hypothetical protein